MSATFEDLVRRLLKVGLPDDQFAQVMLILADAFESGGNAELTRIRENGRKRAARRRALMDVQEPDWYALRGHVLDRDGEVCRYCGDTDGPHHIDHVVPISRGGTSHPDNLAVACQRCNSSKQDKLLEEWGGPSR